MRNHSIITNIILLLSLGLFIVACGTGKQGSGVEEGTETKNTPKFPRTAIGAFFQVSDVSKWTEVYRRDISEETRIGTLQNMENPNLVFVMQWTEDHKSARTMANSDQTRGLMEEGTMLSNPQFRYYDVKFYNNELAGESYRLAVTAEVLNYEMWKSDFDREEPRRDEAGLRMIGLATDAENKNLVYILFSTDDQNKVYEFLGSEETKRAISDSGVIGEPNLTWWKLPEAMAVTR